VCLLRARWSGVSRLIWGVFVILRERSRRGGRHRKEVVVYLREGAVVESAWKRRTQCMTGFCGGLGVWRIFGSRGNMKQTAGFYIYNSHRSLYCSSLVADPLHSASPSSHHN